MSKELNGEWTKEEVIKAIEMLILAIAVAGLLAWLYTTLNLPVGDP